MQQLNSAFLMKLGWPLGTEPNALWARVMRFKYCKGKDLEAVANCQQSASNAWHGLMDVFELTKNGMGHAVGDVRQTKFLVHKWVDGTVLLNHATKEVPANHKERLVCDYWNAEKGWDWDQPAEFLQSEYLQRIASFELIQEEVGDNLTWIANKLGNFSIKTALGIVRGDDTIEPNLNINFD
ncbi:hypothetical protein Cgig2_017500 [Carnegiea gigantea]|uniref:Uncharacterized protein n=1 Tax=Carnegiea gigantea TaxID=171969 RepID=A0A9Q1K3Z9_9CARY|nr:hypothetical protein Cgig2_017500 [Carnegiea gigantea]